MNYVKNKKSSNVKRQRGFTMVELLVAMLLGIFLLAALVEILINGKQSFTSAHYLSRLQENGRIATSMIVSDLKRSGYMGDQIMNALGRVEYCITSQGFVATCEYFAFEKRTSQV